MVPASFQWNDVGSWDEVAKLHTLEPTTGGESEPAADNGSVETPGVAPDGSAPTDQVVEVDAHDNFVHSDLPVALCGVDDLHVVVKNGMVLICRRGESQKVKDVVTELKSRGADDLL
jgi:mannose-1-phosphate guanylyltransferase/mannose-1-phosphate guanylyltransferase/mannose-6-phosphate isomerase